MKKLLTATALLLASLSAHAQYNPFAQTPGYGRDLNQNPGYVVSCPTETGKKYTYWFGFDRGQTGGRVAISRLGLPNGAQIFVRVVDGTQNGRDAYDLMLRTEMGRQFRVKFNGKKGFIDDGQNEYRCTVAKTTFYS